MIYSLLVFYLFEGVTLKYHINPYTGNSNQCKAAKGNCRFATEDGEPAHYDSKEEARAAYEKEMSESTFPQVKDDDESFQIASNAFERAMAKHVDISAMEERVAYTRAKKQELQEAFDRANHVIENHYYSMEDNDPLIHEYNSDYKELEANTSPKERQAVRDYTGIDYMAMNNYLYDENGYREKVRGYKKDEEDSIVGGVKESISRVDSFIAKAKPKDRTLYRVYSQDTTKDFTSSEEFALKNNYVEGNTISMKGFTSTSIDPAQVVHRAAWDEHSVVAFVIKAKSGAPVDYTVTEKSYSQNIQDREREVLLPRDINFKVTKVARSEFVGAEDSYTPLTVYLEEV